MREWWSRLGAWVRGRTSINEDLDREIDSHIDLEAESYMERGMSPHEVRLAARRRFGNPTMIAESARDAWAFLWLESLLKDIRHAFRAIRRSPLFSLVLILTFALGVGVNSAVFSVVRTVLLRPLPYPDSERLVWLGACPRNAILLDV